MILPRLGLQGDISFPVDTGADKSVLMPIDALRPGIDYTALSGSAAGLGIGGYPRMFQEEAAAVFLEGTRALHMYFIQVGIPSYTPEIADVPSLLGRDVLDRWRMHYNPATGSLTFKVNSADRTLTV